MNWRGGDFGSEDLHRQASKLRSVLLAAGDQMWAGASDHAIHHSNELLPLLRKLAELIRNRDAQSVRNMDDDQVLGLLALAQLGMNELLTRAIDRALNETE